VFVASRGTVAMHQLPESGEVSIGRDPSCGILVDDPSVAPRHATLALGPPVRIADAGSGRPLSVRQYPVEHGRPVEVVPGDLIHVGDVILLLEGRGSAPPRRILPHGYFELRLEEECHRAARYHASFALLRIGCDGCAPAVIEQVLANSLRLVDVVASDGAEYEVILIDTPPRDAALVVSRLEAQLAEAGGRPRVGIAVFPRDGRGPDALLAGAGGRSATPSGAVEAIPTSGAMQDIYRMVERIAWSDISVLILGETGVGKERLAEAVHRNSRRAALPFLRLNCAALTDTLLESELFGHERGAFTGAQGVKQGLIESANGGTVFLDEVGEMPMTTQVKLLRVLEERKVRRVGALKSTPIDVRFVAATNRDLEVEVARGTFRKDLYFRLNGISLVIPPLRERIGEIEGLARVLVAESCQRMGRRTEPALSPDVVDLLRQYPWPGNIRELRNVLERAVLLCTGDRIEKAHLPLEKMSSHFAARRAVAASPAAPANDVSEAAPAGGLREQLAQAERKRIVEALAKCAGNQTKAAQALGMSRRTLVKRLSEFNLPRPRKR
jgi:DNA-binding NtrC family response regulator